MTNPPPTPRPQARAFFRPQSRLDWFFVIAIIGKGLNGAVELVGGVLLLFATPASLHHLAFAWTREELSEDPGDLIATHLLHTTDGLTGNAVLFGAAYLLAHGIVKLVLVIALLLNKLWAYPWMIVVLLLFIGYQTYRIILDPTAGLVTLTVFDGHQKRRRLDTATSTREPAPTSDTTW